MTAPPLVVLYSGGKDSNYLVNRLRQDRAKTPIILLCTWRESDGRVPLQGIHVDLVKRQADALGLELIDVPLPGQCDNATYLLRLDQALQPLATRGCRQVACGDLHLADIRQWREASFSRLGFEAVFPLWGESIKTLAGEMAGPGWSITVTSIDTERLPQSMLGEEYDAAFLDALPPGVDWCGENGEFHTFVHHGPGFRHPIEARNPGTVLVGDRFRLLDLRV